MNIIIEIIFYFGVVTATINFIVVLINFFGKIVIDSFEEKETSAKYSILIPARNEEESIGNLLADITKFAQDAEEVIVLDDNSSDNTSNIVQSYSESHSKIKYIQGKELPGGWIGKNWACHQLYLESTTDKFLFLDADVRLKQGWQRVFSEMIKHNLQMLSVSPHQTIKSFGEALTIPLLNWLLLGWLPLPFVRKSKYTSLSAANGQFILITRRIYEKIGGHEAIKGINVDDLNIARSVKMNEEKLGIYVSKDIISCRMYNGLGESVEGLSRSFYRGFGMSKILFITMLTIITISFLVPYILVWIDIKFLYLIVLPLTGKLLQLIRTKIDIWEIPLFPINLIMLVIIGIISLYRDVTGTLNWKGRPI